jgi:hypothetical protein
VKPLLKAIFQGQGAALGARSKERYREHHFIHPVSDDHHQVGIAVGTTIFEFSNKPVGIVECGCVIKQ